MAEAYSIPQYSLLIATSRRVYSEFERASEFTSVVIFSLLNSKAFDLKEEILTQMLVHGKLSIFRPNIYFSTRIPH